MFAIIRLNGLLLQRISACVTVHRDLMLFLCGAILLIAGLQSFTSAQSEPERVNTTEVEKVNPNESGFQPLNEGTVEEASAQTPETAEDQVPEDNSAPFDDSLIRCGTGNMFMLIEGAFGALIMVCAGIGAIVAAIVGAYRLAFTLLFIAVGAFILRSLVSLFFGTDYAACSGGTWGVGDIIGPMIP